MVRMVVTSGASSVRSSQLSASANISSAIRATSVRSTASLDSK